MLSPIEVIYLGFTKNGKKREAKLLVKNPKLRLFDAKLRLSAFCFATLSYFSGALKMADLRRLAPTCADLRRLAPTCADLRRLASVDFQNLS